jgi:hypothetical protein
MGNEIAKVFCPEENNERAILHESVTQAYNEWPTFVSALSLLKPDGSSWSGWVLLEGPRMYYFEKTDMMVGVVRWYFY